jgi:ElaB/YqjD/DUF883 family membrane-anchored ribosome-binding protein
MDPNPTYTDTNGRRPPPAGEAAGEVAGTVKDQAREVAHEVKDQATSLASEVRVRVGEQARTQNEKLAGTIRRLADELDEMAQSREDSPARSVVFTIARSGRQAADYLAERGPDGALREVQDFARRRPGAFLAVAAAAGFVVGRLGKSVWQAGSGPGGDTVTAAEPTRVATTRSGGGVYESATASAAPPAAPVVPAAAAPGAAPTALDDELSAGRASR